MGAIKFDPNTGAYSIRKRMYALEQFVDFVRPGMKRIGVRSSHGELEADIVVDSLEELGHDAFEKLLA